MRDGEPFFHIDKLNKEYEYIKSLINYKYEDEKREHMPLLDKKTNKQTRTEAIEYK